MGYSTRNVSTIHQMGVMEGGCKQEVLVIFLNAIDRLVRSTMSIITRLFRRQKSLRSSQLKSKWLAIIRQTAMNLPHSTEHAPNRLFKTQENGAKSERKESKSCWLLTLHLRKYMWMDMRACLWGRDKNENKKVRQYLLVLMIRTRRRRRRRNKM